MEYNSRFPHCSFTGLSGYGNEDGKSPFSRVLGEIEVMREEKEQFTILRKWGAKEKRFPPSCERGTCRLSDEESEKREMNSLKARTVGLEVETDCLNREKSPSNLHLTEFCQRPNKCRVPLNGKLLQGKETPENCIRVWNDWSPSVIFYAMSYQRWQFIASTRLEARSRSLRDNLEKIFTRKLLNA